MLADLAAKAQGDDSMPTKARNDGRDVRRGLASPVRMVRLCLSNPSSPGETHTRHTISEVATLEHIGYIGVDARLSPARNRQ